MASPGPQQRLAHFLLLPYSEQGHINPMLSLASQLAALGCRVTFVKAERNATAATSSCPPTSESEGSKNYIPATAEMKDNDDESAQDQGLHFVTLPAPPGSSAIAIDDRNSRHLVFKKTLAGLEERQLMISKIVEDSKASAHPISCLICDCIMWRWVKHVVQQHRLQSAVLSIFSAVCFYKFYMGQLQKGHHHVAIDTSEEGVLYVMYNMQRRFLSLEKDIIKAFMEKGKAKTALRRR